MHPVIYKLPDVSDSPVVLATTGLSYDVYPSPKLIRLGYNTILEKLNIPYVLSNPYHKTGLAFDFDRTDKNSMEAIVKKAFGLKKADLKPFCPLWEIITFMEAYVGLNKKAVTVSTNMSELMEEVTAVHKKIHKGSTYAVTDASSKGKKGAAADLVYHYFSSVDLDENAYVHLLCQELSLLLGKQAVGSSMILQVFDVNTDILSGLVYLMSSYYKESYVFKPSVVSDLSNEKYLIFLQLKSKPELPSLAMKDSMYLSDISVVIPEIFTYAIQCINADLIPRKLNLYQSIKKYVDSRVYEGVTHDDMIAQQDSNASEWIESFGSSKKAAKLIETELTRTSQICDRAAEYNNAFAMI